MILEEERNKVCEQCGSPLASSAGAPGCLRCLLEGGLDEVDERRFQHYEIELCPGSDALRELGRGAMGITYRATDLNLGASVALKVISARYSNQVDARERFHEEARVAARLRHPNVASVFHFGETPSRRCFYAMELVEGETLEERVRREVSLGAALVLEIATQVARALLAAAKHGLVHRDLKPSNLMLLPNEQGDSADVIVKVIDFGLAKTIQEPTQEHSAQSGFSGTPGFASPEQTGAGLRTLDVRSDIYSLGATLRYALTGRPPPEKNAANPGRPVQLDDLRRRNLPEPLIALLRSMLADDPAGRPQSARELLHAIENCQRQLAAPQRRRWLAAVSALMAISALAGGFGLTKLFEQDHRATVGIQDAPPAKSIAVLPFENLSDEKENSNFANGIQDEILSDLARIADLKVISRTSVMQYKSGAPRNSREIGRQLGVSLLLEGSVQRVTNQVRVNVQLIDARTDAHLWAQTYDRDLADVFAIQSEIAEGIADQLRSKLLPTERAAIAAPPTTNLAAYQLYTEALTFEIWNSPAGAGAGLARRADLLHQATQLDPTFAAAYCLLAN
ncbi:MAG TPA: serine/threonine-protein kinase, partial [Chthoniobacterales bacterium]